RCRPCSPRTARCAWTPRGGRAGRTAPPPPCRSCGSRATRPRPSRPRSRCAWAQLRSEDLEDFVDRTGRVAPAGRHADDAVEEAVLLRCRLEIRRGAEVILAGIDLLALVELF